MLRPHRLTLISSLLLSSTTALAAPMPTGFYDATYTDLAKNTRIDWDHVHRATPSYAEARGLVGAPTVQVRRNYVYVEDPDGVINAPARTERDLSTWFNFALREVYKVLPEEHVFIYLFTSFQTGVGAFFYQHQANDIRGIGLPYFDNNDRSPVQGFIFMNDWQAFQDMWGQFGDQVVRGFSRSVFNQEAGHRWIVSFERGGASQRLRDLLGRDDAHWSYFMDSGASPMEGNWWRDNGNGTFTTRTDFNNWRFNTLDLYLMGLLPLDQVQPWFLITDVDTRNARDIYNQVPTPPSPPQIIQPVTVGGTRVNYDITDVTGELGQRFPPAGSAPTSFRVVFVMLATASTRLTSSQKTEFETMVDGYAAGFHEGTGNRARLDYALMAQPAVPVGGACQNVSECDSVEATVCTAVGGANICTRACRTADSCPAGYCCQTAAALGYPVCTPTRACMMTTTPDAGVPDLGTADAGSAPQACTCDTTYACDQDCACDPECFANPNCTCDQTFACDPDCTCDPECGNGSGGGSGGGGSIRTTAGNDGCGCASTGEARPSAAWLLVLGLALLRRRR